MNKLIVENEVIFNHNLNNSNIFQSIENKPSYMVTMHGIIIMAF